MKNTGKLCLNVSLPQAFKQAESPTLNHEVSNSLILTNPCFHDHEVKHMIQLCTCCHRGAAAVNMYRVQCIDVSTRRSPPPQGGERVSSAAPSASPPPSQPPSAFYVVSHWFSGAFCCPGNDAEQLA